ncbi:ephrin-B1 [Eurytemora carolleeae]|uniref:ephrin-B1 n=1 Tax=Eurytemora carolleeae TaxID=1294199 RepID=UPI000C757F3A|nr:ephrin-B1 [Eurytemora carolleeae]|eukprot:XP_023343456.1 ephrin-B1-like [Eurytemora affinis]
MLPVILLALTLCGAKGSKVRNIYWNITTAGDSPVPRTVLVNEGNLPTEYDQVNLICPVYKPGTPVTEQHIIYSVEKDEFDSCRVTSPRPRIVAVCNQPQTFMYFTITFRSFTPTPGGLEFRPGRDYYFISTSNTKDIHRRVGGWCASHNMKMIFRVAENRKTEETSPTPKPRQIPTPAAFWSKYWDSRVPGEEENYIHTRSFHQTAEDTYFKDENLIYHPRRMDKSVDITITASALSSGSTQFSRFTVLNIVFLSALISLF